MSFFCIVRLYNSVCRFIKWVFASQSRKDSKISYYIFSDDYDSDETAEMSRVPEDAVFIEEWEKDGVKKCNLFYDSDEIVRGVYDPFDKEPYVPWIWIGDKNTEVDLTHAMEKYMVVGNVIALDLILHLIQIHHDTEIIYIDARTFEEVKFPNKGVSIRAKNVNDNIEPDPHTS
jgi:hypothetical protein